MLQQLEENKLWFTTFVVALAGFWLLVAFLKTPSNTTTSNAPPPGVSKSSFSRNTTFRLQGIPALLHRDPISPEQVINLLKTAWNINDSVIITIRSLTTDPLDNSKKIATLLFDAPPQSLALPAQRWTTTLPGDAEGRIELTLDVDFFGLTPFHHEPDADCKYDIVALSGLNGHAFGSFKQRGESNFMWIRDALPQHLAQAGVHARVFIYGYDSQLIKSDSFQEISDLGLEFKNKMVQLTQSSAASGMKPLILIGHSLGGILVKQAITSLGKNTVSIHEKRTLERLLGSMFFGTPSQGMDIETMLPMVNGRPNELLVRTLGPSSSMLRNQMDDFRHSFERMSFSAVWYYETRESPTARQCENGKWTMDGPKRRLVDISSATNGMPHDYGRHTVRPVNRSHSEMVKFQGPTDEVYRQALADLKNIISSPISVMVYSLTTEQQEFLKSLDFNRQDSRRDSIARATENTCEWFFSSYEFRTWIDSESAAKGKGLLWVKGNPGVGKSTLMREALRRTQDYVSRASTSIVSFFFNARGEELEKTTRGLYRSFLHQILKHDPNALANLLPDYLERKRGKREDRVEWTEEVLKDYVSRVCRRGISMPVLVFIDALDECTDPEISRLVEFFQRLVDQKKYANANLRVCISSRHCPRPPTFGYPEITVEHHNKYDIYRYIEAELKNYKTLLALRDEIVKRSSGVFLWVRLAIKELREEEDKYSGRPIGSLKRRIKQIPPELKELFGSLLEKIPSAEHPRAICMFQLVLFAESRLTAEFIAAATSFRSETGFQTLKEWTASGEFIKGSKNQIAMITSLSGGLLEFDKDEGYTCQFIHESARDYFLKQGGFKSLSIPQENIHVSGWCHSGFVSSIVNYEQAVLTGCANSWLMGASEAFDDGSDEDSRECADSSDEDGPEHEDRPSVDIPKHLRSAYRIMHMALDHRSEYLHLRIFRTENILRHIELAERGGFSQEATLRSLQQACVATSEHGFYDSLLGLCCVLGMDRFNTATRLIEMDEDPRSKINKYGEDYGGYPLSLACRNDDSRPLVELLLRKGADVNARDKKDKTALMKAISHHVELDVIQLLLAHGADVHIRNHKGETALHKAIYSRKATKLLLRHGADPNVEDNEGRTPLITAGFEASFKSFPPLINAGANVNHKTPSGETALLSALYSWYILHNKFEKRVRRASEAIQSLIQNGLDIYARNEVGNTAYDLWKCPHMSSREDNAAYQLWKEVERSLRLEEGGKSEDELNNVIES